MRGIAPKGESIVLSGGYVDDQDFGDEIIYTGEGGRDASSGRQVGHQTLTGGNLYLAQNCQNGVLVRVSRGHKSESSFRPESGYRYDGEYRVEEFWKELGVDGFNIWRFRLVAVAGRSNVFSSAAAVDSDLHLTPLGSNQPDRTESLVSRVIRNSAVSEQLKSMYDFTCQRCGIRIETPAGPYAECCHIRGLGRPHNGPDVIGNVLCLCPNCHVGFDYGAWSVGPDLKDTSTGKQLLVSSKHALDAEHIRYHYAKSRQ